MKSSSALFVATLFISVAQGQTERISSIQKDLGQADRITIAPGLVSVIEFPQAITEVRIGQPGVLKAQISTVSPRELTLYLSGTAMAPTNLIVRAEKRVFIFDVVPSRSSHQDYVRVRGTFGAPLSTPGTHATINQGAIVASESKSSRLTGTVVQSRSIGGTK